MRLFVLKRTKYINYVFELPEMIALSSPRKEIVAFLIYLHFYENGYLGLRKKLPVHIKIIRNYKSILSTREGYFLKCDIEVWNMIIPKKQPYCPNFPKYLAVYDPFNGEYFKLLNLGKNGYLVREGVDLKKKKAGYYFFKKRYLIFI